MSGRRPARYVPERGDAIWLTFDSHSGPEQRAQRPAVVVSPRSYNSRSGLAVVCAVTSSVKGYPFEVILTVGLPVSGTVLADQVRTIDWRARNPRRICALPEATTNELLDKLSALVGRER